MRLADAAIRGIVNSVAFRASVAPYLLLDTDLRIRAANRSYERATLQQVSEMVGELMFDVFPDNPATPEARSVERLGESFERAMTAGKPDRMALQRYDVRDPDSGTFVGKSWLPSNSPVRDPSGRVVAVLHHVEDVTHLLAATTLELDLVASPSSAGASPLAEGAGVLDALRRDAATRLTRARLLLDRSHLAIERMSRRIEAEEHR